VPRLVWRGAWAVLLGVIGVGLVTAVLLSGGAADPPRAGRLIWQAGPLPDAVTSVYHSTTIGSPVDLPARPYTLEVTGQLAAGSDPAASWGIACDTAESAGPPFSIVLDGQGFFSFPPFQPDSVPFIHIRPAGESNKLALNVEASGQATLRINDEIAWRGVIPDARRAQIVLVGGRATSSRLAVQRVALYAPTP
jgi:hypothetical protein